VTAQLPELGYNTAIAAMMECLNVIRSGGRDAVRAEVEPLVVMIAPFAPHLAEELWEQLGHEGSVFDGANWPEFDPAKAVEDTVEIAVQVNGKLRATITAAKDAQEADVVGAARAEENVIRHIEGKEERRVIHVPGRLVNFVVSG
jgi:leucyl-tRNA synthetase